MNSFQIRQCFFFIIYFVLFIYIVDKGVYYLLNRASDEVFSGQTIGKLNYYLEVKDTTDILVFGSSRANHHIDIASITESGFNTGLDGVRIAYAATLIKLLPKNRPQTVILHLDGYGNDYTGEDIAHLMVKYHRNEIVRKEIEKIKQHNPLQKIFWTLDYNGTVFGIIKNLLRSDSDYMNSKGFLPLYVVPKGDQAVSKLLLVEEDSENCDEITELNSIVQAYLRDVSKFCIENNKRLLVITAPKFRDRCLNEQVVLEMFLNSEGIDYYNFTNLFEGASSIGYWKDRTHLSALGADAFTKHLVEACGLREIQEFRGAFH